MSTIPVYIILSGLVALVPDPTGTNQLTALLVDARHFPAGLECGASHSPKLIIQTTDSDCAAAHCTLPSSSCTCDLDREEISLQITPIPATKMVTLSKRPPRDLPFDRTSAIDYGYVGNMSLLGQTLDPAFRNSVPPMNLVARMQLPFDSIVACTLSTRRDELADNVHELVFRPKGAEESGNEGVVQALAQMVLAKVDSAQSVTVTLTNFDTGAIRTLHPSLNGLAALRIELSNERDHLPVGAPCDDGVGRDFDLFYGLATPTSAPHMIPHVKYTRWKSAADLDPPECHAAEKAPMSRPICPMATFNP
jgi:hypothetical protein